MGYLSLVDCDAKDGGNVNSPWTIDYDHHPDFLGLGEPTSIPVQQFLEIQEIFLAASNLGLGGFRRQHQLRKSWSLFWLNLSNQVNDETWKLFTQEICLRSFRVALSQIDFFQKAHSGNAARTTEDVGELGTMRRMTGRIGEDHVRRLLAIASPQISEFQRRADQNHLRREDLSINSGPVISQLVVELNAIFADNGVLKAVSDYVGRRMIVGGLSLELSDSRATWWRHTLPMSAPPETMYMHLDESINIPKAMLYLTDVGIENGPTSVYPKVWDAMRLGALTDCSGRVVGSVTSGDSSIAEHFDDRTYHQAAGSLKFRRLFMTLPRALRFNSHMGWDVINGSKLEEQLVASEEVVAGQAGTFVAFDGGRLFHRGGLISEGQRIALQITFSPYLSPSVHSKVARRLGRLRMSYLGRP